MMRSAAGPVAVVEGTEEREESGAAIPGCNEDENAVLSIKGSSTTVPGSVSMFAAA
jgi:hypothetical protein